MPRVQCQTVDAASPATLSAIANASASRLKLLFVVSESTDGDHCAMSRSELHVCGGEVSAVTAIMTATVDIDCVISEQVARQDAAALHKAYLDHGEFVVLENFLPREIMD